ncbi:hypothetical protein EJ110_NYTH54174 [Nymphaea thermarum]|nr:hypothetical protein EJ110_NYTH54174 [Nymphaea thermarum]
MALLDSAPGAPMVEEQGLFFSLSVSLEWAAFRNDEEEDYGRTSMGWISDWQRRHVTFSKRRKDLFKKAQELTGATVGIICFSEAGNPFNLAYPPPADGNDGDDGHRRLVSIMQQHYGHSETKLLVAVKESKSISEENISRGLPQPVAHNESLGAWLEPKHGGGAITSDPSSFDFGSFSVCVIEDEPDVGLLAQMQSIDEAETGPPLAHLLLHNLTMTQNRSCWDQRL